MPRQFFITPLVCTIGADGITSCNPKVNAQQVNFTAACQRSTVPNPQCLVLAAGDTTGAEADTSLVSIVADNFDTTIASLPNNIKNRISNGLTSKGIQLTRTVIDPVTGLPTQVPATLTDYVLVRDFLTALGKWFDPNFTLAAFWVSN